MFLKISPYTLKEFYVQKLSTAPGNFVLNSGASQVTSAVTCHVLRDSELWHDMYLQTDAVEAMTIAEHDFLPNKYENSTDSSQKKFILL